MDCFLTRTFVNPDYIDKADYGNLETSLTSIDFSFLHRITKTALLPPCLLHHLSLQDSSETFWEPNTVYATHSTVSPLLDSPIDVTGRKQNIASSLAYELFLEGSKIFPSSLDGFGLKGFSNVLLPAFLQPSHNLLNLQICFNRGSFPSSPPPLGVSE